MNIAINDNITSNLLNLIYTTSFNSSKPLNILNIGCDVSRIYNSLIYKYKESKILNIEMDTLYKYNVDKVPNTVLGSIYDLDSSYEKDSFDIVIFDDTIARFVDPWKILRVANKCLKKDGYLFVSIPNIMHVNVVSNLISGKFEYSNSGPLNKDNLRFFTLMEIRKLFDTTGFNLLNISSVSTDRNTQSMQYVNIINPNATEEIIDQFHCYQYIIKSNAKEIKTLVDYVYN